MLSNKEFIPCNDNGCDKGYIYSVDNGVDSITPCICLLSYRHELELINKYISANLPKKSWSYNISDYVGPDNNKNIPKLKTFVNKFDEKFKDKKILLFGDYGNQKSSLARWMVKELIKRGKTAHYTLTNSLLRNLVKLKDEDKDINEFEILNVDFLVLDEWGVEKILIYNSGYQISFLLDFLKLRLEQINKATIFISNDNINDVKFKEKFGHTITDLISRELNATLIFEDNYEKLSKNFEIDDLWS